MPRHSQKRGWKLPGGYATVYRAIRNTIECKLREHSIVMNRICDAYRAGCATAVFAHRAALPSCLPASRFSCEHEICPSRPGRLRNSLPRHSQKRIYDAYRAGCAIAAFAHRAALPSYLPVSRFSCEHEICPSRPGRLRNSLPRHSQNASAMLTALAAPPLLLLIERRFLRAFLQADFHASMKSACRKTRVNCVKMY